MNKEKIIPNGTEVLIFSKYGYKTKSIAKGVIINSKDSGDISYHGSPWSVQVYKVLGENEVEYFGSYGNDLMGDYFFRTRENYTKFLQRLILYNNDKISELKQKNSEFKKIIESESLIRIDKTSKKLVKRLNYEKK